MSLRDLLRAPSGDDDPLAVHPTGSHPGVAARSEAEAEAVADGERLADLQERLWAEHSRAVLLVLQGIDTSGKDGAIKYVTGLVNPLGCRITSFSRPTPEEARHHFLWRIWKALPGVGQIGVFGRSHYEDVIIPRVRGGLTDAELDRRYAQIIRFEAGLAAGSTTIIKCVLHIGFEEQRERLLARLEDPDKRWKFDVGDLDDRDRWPQFEAAYREVLRRTNLDGAPWYVVPADRKWYRNWAVARLLLETLTEMAPDYPRPALDIPALKARLKAGGDLDAVH